MQKRMEELSAKIQKNRKEWESISNEMQAVIVEAHSAGYSVVQIAAFVGIARQTVYTALKKA